MSRQNDQCTIVTDKGDFHYVTHFFDKGDFAYVKLTAKAYIYRVSVTHSRVTGGQRRTSRAFEPATVTVTNAFVQIFLFGGKIMKFILTIVPPTATAQMKKVRVVRGRPMFYEPSGVKAAKTLLMSALRLHRPKEPMTGALELTAVWKFPRGRHKDGAYRVTRPDTDNLQKMLKDCMTQTVFWKDDAQVVREVVEKRWAETPCIEIEIRELEEST